MTASISKEVEDLEPWPAMIWAMWSRRGVSRSNIARERQASGDERTGPTMKMEGAVCYSMRCFWSLPSFM